MFRVGFKISYMFEMFKLRTVNYFPFRDENIDAGNDA